MTIPIRIIVIRMLIIIKDLEEAVKEEVVEELIKEQMQIIISTKRKKSILRSLRLILRIISKKFKKRS